MGQATEAAATRGTARDVLAIPAYRNLLVATFISNCGRWLQFAALGVLAWELTGSNTFLGQLIFAQLLPLGVLSLIGGSLADTVDRRKLLLITQTWQMVWTFVLAAALLDGTIGEGMLLLLVFIIGIGQGLYAPAFTSIVPLLAGEENVRAAVSLNSVQLNGARVIGPGIGGVLAATLGFAELFAINAATYLVVIGAIWVMTLPKPTASAAGISERLFGGFTILKRAPQIRGPIVMMALFSFFCLPFIGQLPAIAEVNLGIDSQSSGYAWFYATFGAGALIGALSVSTVLLNFPRPLLVRLTLIGFAASLLWLALLDEATLGYPAIFLVSLFYFVMPTTLATHWQEHVTSKVRGRVAALWVLSFGGVIPFANLVGGQFADSVSLTALMLVGVGAAVILALFFRLKSGEVIDEVELAPAPT